MAQIDDAHAVALLRSHFRPNGSADVVRIEAGYYNGPLVREAIDNISKLPILSMLGQEPSALERFAIGVLCSEAGINFTGD